MKKSLAVLSGVLALSLVVAPAAFAAQGTQAHSVTVEDIDLTNAAPSVQQEGSVVINRDPVTLDDGTVVTPVANADGVASSELEVYVTGATDVTSDAASAVGEAQKVADDAIAVAQGTGNTAESMLATNPELASSGLSTNNSIVTTEFYLGIQDKAGKPYSGNATVALNLPSAEEAAQVSMVLYYNATTKKWVSVPFVRTGNKIVLQVRLTGVYRFVTNV